MIRTLGLHLSLLAVALIFSAPAIAQDAKVVRPDETTAQIPILNDFHDVIIKIWHTAWPEKNVTMLAELLPEVRHYADSIAKVQLPGILRDKQKVWKENTAKLQEIVAEYAKRTSPLDSQKLLDAAEKLHAQYEKLVRVTRPVLKEVEAFHQVLYVLYHHYLPNNNQEKIVSSVKELKEKMVALEKAALPERLKKKEAAFNGARAALARSVAALDTSMVKGNPQEFGASMETMHADYQALEKVFE